MNYQRVLWKPVECKSGTGQSVLSNYPREIDHWQNGTLLSQIVSMPKQRPISFDKAINLVVEFQKDEWESGRMVRYPNFWSWHLKNFVPWLTALGYHIELSGDEFDPLIRST